MDIQIIRLLTCILIVELVRLFMSIFSKIKERSKK